MEATLGWAASRLILLCVPNNIKGVGECSEELGVMLEQIFIA